MTQHRRGETILCDQACPFPVPSGFYRKNILEIGLLFSSRSIFIPYGTLCALPASLANIYALLIARRETDMDEILTANEAAALLKVHKRTVYRLADQGIIPGNRIGHRWRFNRTHILALVSKSDGAGSLKQSAPRASSLGVLE